MALALLLASAVLHAGWNLLLKRAEDRAAFLWWAQAVAVAAYAPVALALADVTLPRGVWPLLLASGLAEAGYVFSLSRAYGVGDLSLVYPVSRGSAPLFVAAGGAAVLGERLTPLGYAGIAAVAAGIAAIAAPSRLEVRRALRGDGRRAVGLALLTALFIAGYTVSDKAALDQVSPVVWTLWAFVAMEAFLAPYFLIGRRRSAALAEWRARWRSAVLAGALALGTALLVLAALALTTASYVGAVRGVSVVFAAALGWLVLGEPWGARRVAAAAIVFAGIACLSLAGE